MVDGFRSDHVDALGLEQVGEVVELAFGRGHLVRRQGSAAAFLKHPPGLVGHGGEHRVLPGRKHTAADPPDDDLLEPIPLGVRVHR
jgi:hypothetical protein